MIGVRMEGIPMENAQRKRPLWHWIVLFALAGVLAYSLVHYFLIAGNGSGDGSGNAGNSYDAPPQAEPTPESGT